MKILGWEAFAGATAHAAVDTVAVAKLGDESSELDAFAGLEAFAGVELVAGFVAAEGAPEPVAGSVSF